MCETTILRKLGLSTKFPREVLYSRKSAMGIGLLKPSTIIAILAMKLYIGHKRANDRIANIIQINEEHAEWQYGINSNILNISSSNKFNQIIWNDEIGEILKTRNMTVSDHKSMIGMITNNKTIMDYAIQYIKNSNKSSKIIPIINHVRMCK